VRREGREVWRRGGARRVAAGATAGGGRAAVDARPRFGMGPGPMMMGPGGMDGPAMMLPLLLRSANLTPEQEAQVQKIMADRRAQTRALVREMRAGEAALLDKPFAAGDPKVDGLKPELDRLP